MAQDRLNTIYKIDNSFYFIMLCIQAKRKCMMLTFYSVFLVYV